MASQQRTRSTNLQCPPPNPVTQQGTDRSVVSDLTNPTPPKEVEDDDVIDADDDYENFVENEIEKDIDGGDGGDSDVEGDECLHFEESDEESEDFEEVEVERKDSGKSKGFVDLTDSSGGVIGNVIFEEGDVCSTELASSIPKDVKIYKPPSDWRIPMTQHERDEPMFEDVDNPGNWPQYCFRPRFKGNAKSKNTKYSHHSLPTGAIPVPKNKDGKRVINGWEFFYNGWKNPGTQQHRRGATTANMFPKEMEGCLDAEILAKLGLNEGRMGKTGETDALFFYQLILPICNPQHSGVKDDPRKSYYHDIEGYTNSSRYHSGMGGSYGHEWNPVNLKELTNWDGILIRDGVLGGTQGAIHRRWDAEGPCYAAEIATAMSLRRFQDMKRSLKLCNNYEVPKRGQGEYEKLLIYREN